MPSEKLGSTDAAAEFARQTGKSVSPHTLLNAAKAGRLEAEFTANGRMLTTRDGIAEFARNRAGGRGR